MRSCFGILLTLVQLSLFGQDGQNLLIIDAKIIDGKSQEPLPYATVYNISKGIGIVSNANGSFRLRKNAINDTIIISYIGYEKQTIIVSRSIVNEVIRLNPKTELLQGVNVYADDPYLYKLMARAKKTQVKKKREAKTYYALKSIVNNEQVELVEAYYNGSYYGYDTQRLRIKQGRIGLIPFKNRYFVSSESSRVMYLHNMFQENEYFPQSPFELSRKKLEKHFNLFLISKYLTEDSLKILVVGFETKYNPAKFFSGQVWIDSVSAKIIKVNLRQDSTGVHPFLPFGHLRLNKVSLSITKNFHALNDEMFVNSVNFNYGLRYLTENDSVISMTTEAVIFVYDYNNLFMLPQFEFSSGRYEDYRKMNVAPYNNFFWNNINEFRMSDMADENDFYFKNSSSITNETGDFQNAFTKSNKSNLFENPYVLWNKKRIRFSTRFSSGIPTYNNSVSVERYRLKAQIYMDVNDYEDSVNVITKTFFDPYESYYHFKMTDEAAAFINMYFDLVEICRRELEREIKGLKDVNRIAFLYRHKLIELEGICTNFFEEVQRGTNPRGMMRWNRHIYDKIGITNLGIFDLHYD